MNAAAIASVDSLVARENLGSLAEELGRLLRDLLSALSHVQALNPAEIVGFCDMSRHAMLKIWTPAPSRHLRKM